jgi:hypothetical protein
MQPLHELPHLGEHLRRGSRQLQIESVLAGEGWTGVAIPYSARSADSVSRVLIPMYRVWCSQVKSGTP